MSSRVRAASGPHLRRKLLHLRTVRQALRDAVHLGRRGHPRAPPATAAAGPRAVVGARAQQAQGAVVEPRLPHPGLAPPPRRDAVAAVLLEVAVQVVGAHESLEAAGALVGPQAGVHAHVVLQVVVVGEGGSTLCTQVRLLSCMLTHVNLELVLPEGGEAEAQRSRGVAKDKNVYSQKFGHIFSCKFFFYLHNFLHCR